MRYNSTASNLVVTGLTSEDSIHVKFLKLSTNAIKYMRKIKIKMLINNIGWSLVFKATGMFCAIAQLPLYVEFFDNKSDLALWFVILSIFNIIIYSDLGISSGLKNFLVMHLENKDLQAFNKKLGSALFSSLIIGVCATGLLLTSVHLSPEVIIHYFNLSSQNDGQIIPTVSAVIIAAGILFPLRIALPILHSIQKTAAAALIPLCTQLAMLFYLLFDFKLIGGEGLLDLALMYSAFTILPYLFALCALVFFGLRASYSPVGLFRFNFSDIKIVVSYGFKFFIIQLCIISLVNTNEMIIFRLEGDEQVVDYQFHYRLYSIFIVGFSTVSIPLWSAISVAHFGGAKSEISRFLLGAILIFPILAFIVFAFSFYYPQLSILFYSQGTDNHSQLSAYLFGLFAFLYCALNIATAFLNGLNEINLQVFSFLLSVVLKIGYLLFFYSSIGGFGGVLISTILPFVILLIVFIVKIVYTLREGKEDSMPKNV